MITDEPMLSFVDRLKTWWTTAERNQKVVTLGGIGALLFLLVGSAMFMTRPHYVTLVDGLSDADKSKVVAALEAAGFKAGIDKTGTVEIAESDKAKAQLALAAANAIPKSTHWGENDLMKAGPFTSPEVERETLNSIREGEIATVLEQMDGVASANVIITSPKQSVFADNDTHPTASVTLVEDGQGTLTRANGKTIANLVSSAVDGMTPNDVMVVSNSLGELWNPGGNNDLDSKSDLDAKVAHGWETKLQSALDEVFGAGNTKVLVTADVDTDKVHSEEREVTPTAKPTEVTSEKETLEGGAKLARGVSGATSNTSETSALMSQSGGSNDKNYRKEGKQQSFDKNEKRTVTEHGGGGLKSLAISVVANSEKVPDATAVKQIVDGVMGGKMQVDATGAPLPNQAFSTTVTSVKFDGSAAQAAKEAADRAASQQRNQQILSLLPIAAILLIALMVAKQVGKISRAVLPVPVDPIAEMVENDPDALPGEEGPDALPAPATMEATEEQIELEKFEAQLDVPLESLKQMAAERPEMVATLIKSMLLGDFR